MAHPPSLSSTACKDAGSGKVLLRKRTYDATKKKWSPWSDVYTRQPQELSFTYNFPRGGGQLRIYANLLISCHQRAVTDELMECGNFRQYSIQSSPEPRTHFLLHENATVDFDGAAQPGYRYGSLRMKSRPLHSMLEIQELSIRMQNMCQDRRAVKGSFWNIGVNPVLYRDGRDRIGYHADNDQGEELILTVLVSSPVGATRRICIRDIHFKTEGTKDKDEELELRLDAGDAYSMDGKDIVCESHLLNPRG